MKSKARILAILIMTTIMIGGCGKTADTKDVEKEAAVTTTTEKANVEKANEKETVVKPTETVETKTEKTIVNYYVNDENPPKSFQLITTLTDWKRDNSGNKVPDDDTKYEDTYYLCVNAYPSDGGPTQYVFKMFVYHLYGEGYANKGECEKYVFSPDSTTYDDICTWYLQLSKAQCKDTMFTPLVEGVDYMCDISDNGTETYRIINESIIYSNINIHQTVAGIMSIGQTLEPDAIETVMNADGSSSYYPYDSGSNWSKTIDSWLEEYLYVVAQCFDNNIKYD